MAERVGVRRQAGLDAPGPQRGLGDRPQAVVGGGVDQQQVEPVAHAQAVGRVGDEPGDVRLGRAGVEVEHTAAVGVGEHAGARGGAERGELPGDVAAAAHDHERDELGQADQRVGARVAGGGHELHRLGGHAVGGERRGDHVLHEGLRAAQRGRARAQDGRAAGLEHLRRHVDRDVGPGLEHRADHADGHAALVHPLPRRQVADEHLQRRLRGGGEDVELGGHVGEALGGEAETVEQALGHAARLGGLDVGAVGGEQRLGPLAQEPGGGAQRGVDRRATRGPDARRGRGGALGGRADGGLLGGVRGGVDDGGAHGPSLPRARPAPPRPGRQGAAARAHRPRVAGRHAERRHGRLSRAATGRPAAATGTKRA